MGNALVSQAGPPRQMVPNVLRVHLASSLILTGTVKVSKFVAFSAARFLTSHQFVRLVALNAQMNLETV